MRPYTLIPLPSGLLETIQASLVHAHPTAAIVKPLWLTHVHFLLKCAVQKCRLHIKLV